MNTLARTVTLLLAAALLALSGCQSSGGGKIPDQPPPSYERVAEVYNNRVAPIENLWARATVQVTGRDSRGKRFREQGEGHLQIERPSNVSLTVGKLGDTHLAFGSGRDRYWFFDLIEKDDRRLVFGRHSEYERAKGRMLGSPVHPLELLDGVGITPLPTTPPADPVRWHTDGESVVVVTRQGSGWRRMALSPTTGEPSEILLLDSFRTPVVRIELESYETAPKSGDTRIIVRVPTRVDIYTLGPEGEPVEDSMVRLELYDAKIRPIRAIVFDLDRLARAYQVNDVTDLDDLAPVLESDG